MHPSSSIHAYLRLLGTSSIKHLLQLCEVLVHQISIEHFCFYVVVVREIKLPDFSIALLLVVQSSLCLLLLEFLEWDAVVFGAEHWVVPLNLDQPRAFFVHFLSRVRTKAFLRVLQGITSLVGLYLSCWLDFLFDFEFSFFEGRTWFIRLNEFLKLKLTFVSFS
jgi:hypothetical protein